MAEKPLGAAGAPPTRPSTPHQYQHQQQQHRSNNILVYVEEDYDGGGGGGGGEVAGRRAIIDEVGGRSRTIGTVGLVRGRAASFEGRRCEAESTTSSCDFGGLQQSLAAAELQRPSAHTIAAPHGWKRIIANGIVLYISPSNAALSCLEEVKNYLLSDGTCKCGLECPINPQATFNFNPKVLTRPWAAPVIGPSDLTKLCNHKRKHISQTSIDLNKYDGFRKKKRRSIPSLPPGVLSSPSSESESKELEKSSFNGLPWRGGGKEEGPSGGDEPTGQGPETQPPYRNGYQEVSGTTGGYREDYHLTNTPSVGSPHLVAHNQHSTTSNQVNYEVVRSPGVYSYEKQPKVQQQPPPGLQQQQQQRLVATEEVMSTGQHQQQQPLQDPVASLAPPPPLSVNRTPPWQQNRQQQQQINNTYERVPPLHPVNNPPTPPASTSTLWNTDINKKKQIKCYQKKKYPEDGGGVHSPRSTPEPPSFLEDPSGYLAQQTALLNSTISRQAELSVCRVLTRPKCSRTITAPSSRYPPDSSSLERRKNEEPTSTHQEKSIDDRGPIQGAAISTSDRSPVELRYENVVTTMASSHTHSSNTITSVLAGRANTATVSVSNQNIHKKPEESQQIIDDSRQILVSSPNQVFVANSMLPGQSKPQQQQVLNQHQPTVLLPGPLLLQPTNVVVDGLNTTVQIPTFSNVVQNQVIDDTSLLSPDSKRKAHHLKKRKLSPLGSVLLSPGSNNVMVQPQQLNTPIMQAVTILPSKTSFAGTQQLITTNMLQPLNLVQNFPLQQFIVPAGVGSMVMSDGTMLHDTVQLNLLAPVQNNVFSSSSQNLLAPTGMVLRSPNSQNSGKVIQNNQFINSPNQQLFVNNTYGGPLSPLLSVSPNQVNRNQEFLPQNVVVQNVQQQQPSSSNSTLVQQNTTIVQQTTMVSNHQTQPTHSLNLNQNFIISDKPNFILTSDKQNFILSPNSGEKILISPDSMRGSGGSGNFLVSNVEKQNFVINNTEKQNIVINNYERKNYHPVEKRNSVSTQTQVQQQTAESPGVCRESPPDTTTLSPRLDEEVSTSHHRSLEQLEEEGGGTSPPQQPHMVHCVSSSSHLADEHASSPFIDNNYIG